MSEVFPVDTSADAWAARAMGMITTLVVNAEVYGIRPEVAQRLEQLCQMAPTSVVVDAAHLAMEIAVARGDFESIEAAAQAAAEAAMEQFK